MIGPIHVTVVKVDGTEEHFESDLNADIEFISALDWSTVAGVYMAKGY